MQKAWVSWVQVWPVLVVLALAIAAGLCTSACESSSEEHSTTNVVSALVGSWNLIQVAADGQVRTPAELSWSWQIAFNSDHTYTAVQTWQGINEEYDGVWATSGNQLTLEDSITGEYSISGDKLNLVSTDYDGQGNPGTLVFQKL